MGKKRRGPKKQESDYFTFKLNPNAREFVPAVISSVNADGKYSANRHASILVDYNKEMFRSSRPHPYTNNNNEDKLSFSFLKTDDGEIEINEPRMDFVSELPSLVVEKILQHLNVTSIQNCRKVSRRWNDVIIELESSVSVIKDLDSDADFLVRLVESRKFWDSPEEPFYIEADCATCKDCFYDCYFTFDIKHDVIKLLSYYLDCEDESKKYVCHLCPDKKKRTKKSRKQSDQLSYKKSRDHFDHLAHLVDRHGDFIDKFLLKQQRLIPLCGKAEPNDCEYSLRRILCESFHSGDAEPILSEKKYRPPSTPPSPRSPKCWEYMNMIRM